MSKRTERRAAERAARKINFQKLREERSQPQSNSSQQPPVIAQPSESEIDTITPFQPLAPIGEPEIPAQPASKSVSEAQLAANRANAQLSTGAITPEGKAASSLNALKHGLTAKTVLLPHEDSAEYQRQLDAYLNLFKPVTEDEVRLVQSQVDCIWRLNRIQRLETAIMLRGQIEFANKHEDRKPLERAHLIDAEAYLKYERQIRNLYIQEARLRRTMDKDRIELARIQATRRHRELALMHAQIKAEKALDRTGNGFEFSSQPTPQPNAPEAARQSRSRAA